MEKDNLEILLEDIKEKFELVLEGNAGLHHEIKQMRAEMNDKFEFVDFKIDTLNKKIDGVHNELDVKIDGVYNKLDVKIDGVHDKLDKKIDGVHDKLDAKIDGLEISLKKEINRVEKKIDGVAADLTAHRADTESHSTIYKVKE
ncbi:MAG: hypothetical protein NT010_16695 [Proteobacteria bacterium]|nr:hypothetical protein [Pseudomonadota bacterium]